MNQRSELNNRGDVVLADYLSVLIRLWWVIVIVFLVVVAIGTTYASSLPDIYEARTKILVVSPVSEQLLAVNESEDGRVPINPFLGSSISLATLTSLGTANDILDDVIQQLGLRSAEGGELWAIEQLRNSITVELENSKDSQTSLPLLTMSARGGDPKQVKLIAETWAELFVSQSSGLFAAEAARTFNFVLNQYDDTVEALQKKEDERLNYQQVNSLESLQSQFNVLTIRYESFLDQLHSKRSEVVEAQAKLKSAGEAMLNESQFITLEQSISNEALLVLIAGNADQIDIEALPKLMSLNQERNHLFFALKEEIVASRSKVESLNSEIDYLGEQTVALDVQLKELSSQIAEISLNLRRADREIKILSDNFALLGQSLQMTQITNQEQSGFMQIVESAVTPRFTVGPDRQRLVLISAAVGFIGGIIMAYLLHYVRQEFWSPRKLGAKDLEESVTEKVEV